jgi:hypothetical protein
MYLALAAQVLLRDVITIAGDCMFCNHSLPLRVPVSGAEIARLLVCVFDWLAEESTAKESTAKDSFGKTFPLSRASHALEMPYAVGDQALRPGALPFLLASWAVLHKDENEWCQHAFRAMLAALCNADLARVLVSYHDFAPYVEVYFGVHDGGYSHDGRYLGVRALCAYLDTASSGVAAAQCIIRSRRTLLAVCKKELLFYKSPAFGLHQKIFNPLSVSLPLLLLDTVESLYDCFHYAKGALRMHPDSEFWSSCPDVREELLVLRVQIRQHRARWTPCRSAWMETVVRFTLQGVRASA